MLQDIAKFFRQRFGSGDDHEQQLHATLNAFRNPEADTLELARRLIALMRPQSLQESSAGERQKVLLAQLEADPELLVAFRHHIVHFIATRRLVTFFTDSGILPGTGFFSEWWRILWNRFLPEVPDERRLKDCLHVLYDRTDDWRWLEQQPPEASQQLWALLAPNEELRSIDWLSIQDQILDSVLLLAHRVSGLGVDSELMRAAPDFDQHSPRFIALSAEALDFVNAFRQRIDSAAPSTDDGSHLLVMADQCVETLQRIRKRALTVGTSLHLSYILTRSEQSLERLRELVAILISADRNQEEAISAWSTFAREAFLAENRRNSMRYYMSQLSRLMAVRVTENAALC
jgi:site-specific recombinase